ncbi:MAG: hypothetical protein KF904_06790 [Rhodoblastus sp.]|nr:hypothetical protein [Rhodoblastus sp.]MCB1542758.1 hypothetical protein [Rhodoblastus sp.]
MMDESELNTYAGLLDMFVRGFATLWLIVSVYIFVADIGYREFAAPKAPERDQYTSSFLVMMELVSFPSTFVSKSILQECDPSGRVCKYRFDQDTFFGAMAIWSVYEFLQGIFWVIVIKAVSLLKSRPA